MFGFDIIPKEYDLWQNVYCMCMFILISGLFYKTNVCSLHIWNKRYLNTSILLLLLYYICTLSIYCSHDYFSYYQIIKYDALDDSSHLESPYLSIIRFFNRNYLSFRLIVWGGALTFFCIGAKQARINIYHSLYILAACFFVNFAYGRSSLATTMCFCGYIIFIQNKNKNIFKALLGIGLFLSAYFFHHSMILVILMAIIMTYLPINKKIIWIIIFMIPILFTLAKVGYEHILINGGGLNEDAATLVIIYSDRVADELTFLGKLGKVFDYGIFYIITIIGIKKLLFDHKQSLVPALTVNLFKISLGLIFIGTCFFFFGLSNNVFVYRILYMTIVPLTYCVVSFYSNKVITKKQLRFIVLFGITNGIFYLLGSVRSQL